LEEKVRLRLALSEGEITEPFFIPRRMSLEAFVKQSRFVLLGLHGGIGENGTLQRMLTKAGVKFNGPGAEASAICMDKAETGKRLAGLEKQGILVAPKQTALASEFKKFTAKDFEKYFASLQKKLRSRTLIVKPQDEGCSSGIVRLFTAKDLQNYMHFVLRGAHQIPRGTFKNQKDPIEMPLEPMQHLLFEQFIEVDFVRVKNNHLKWRRKKGWVEVTIGVIQDGKSLHALSPSLTVAEGEVLSVEEKFQGGTGVNMTPPPEKFVKPAVLARVKKSAEKVAMTLGIEGYCRMDAFIHIDTGELILIEVNTLPALTPSTVLYHQGLAEKKPIYPLELLEKIVENKGY
jgi:D-alanine-D-alanine ligase-like ATP-grasp enzyme